MRISLANVLARSNRVKKLLRRFRDPKRKPSYDQWVEYSLNAFESRRHLFREGGDVLELGSGRHMCLAALLLGAVNVRRVVNIEIDAYGFCADAKLYRLLLERARSRGIRLEWPLVGFEYDEATDSIRPDDVRFQLHLGKPMQEVPNPDASFDAAFSISVLQHVRLADLAGAVSEMHRVTKAGGVGHHRLDLRDLYNLSDPFRFLTMDQLKYERKYANRSNYSNRYRLDDFLALFRASRFDAHATDETLMGDAEFMSVYDRIHPAYKDKDRAVLQVTMCVIETRKRAE